MSAQNASRPRAVAGDNGGSAGSGAPSIVAQGPAAEGPCEAPSVASRTAAGPWVGDPQGNRLGHAQWPTWAAVQLRGAVRVARETPPGLSVAAHLYRNWFNFPLAALDGRRMARSALPLAGVYRAAHAGSARRVGVDGVVLIDRQDVVGPDGWWRTWGRHWIPPRDRGDSVRILLTPAPERLGAVVRTVTAALLDSAHPWAFACATRPRRTRRCSAAILDLPAPAALPPGLIAALEPDLRPEIPPLCLPLGRGVALAAQPGSGTTFGEHRCHLIALALRRASGDADPLTAIADVFTFHGIDPAAPFRYAR